MITPSQWTEWGEYAILAGGGLLLVVGAGVLTARRGWRDALTLPPPRIQRITPMDVFVSVFFFIGTATILHLAIVEAFDLQMPGVDGATTSDGILPDPSLLTGVSAAAQLLSIVLVGLLARHRFVGRLADWGLSARGLPGRGVQAVVIYVAVWPVCAILLNATTWLLVTISGEPTPEHSAIVTLQDAGGEPWVRVVTIASAIVLAPMVEEFVFRGLLHRVLAESFGSAWVGIGLSGMAFGFVHMGVPQTVPSLVVFGVVLAYVYARTESLTLCILIHAVFNAKTIVWLLIDPGAAE